MKKNIAIAFALVAALLVTGCATVQMADTGQDAAAKTFKVAPGKAGIYIYRNETFGAAVKLDVFLDGRPLGETVAKSYFYEEVNPGRHTVVGKGENESSVSFQALAGRLYYIWQEVKFGFMFARNELKLVDDNQGRAGVLESQRIMSTGAK